MGLDPKHPIPIEYGGDLFYTVRGKKYLPFLGAKDNFATLLLEARLISTTQNACVNTISQSVIGKGLTCDKEKPAEDWTTWTEDVNNENQSLDEVLESAMDGERAYGNQFIEIKRMDLMGNKFIKIYLHEFQFCRLSEPDEKTGKPKFVYISKLFAKKGVRNVDLNKVKKIPLWSSNILDANSVWIKNEDGTESTMLHFLNKVSGIEHYGLPESIAGLRYQVQEGEAAQYNIDNFENNMILGGMLIFKAGMTREEAQENAKEIVLSHTGKGKTGRIAVISSESGLQDVDFKPYDTQKEGSFIELDKRIEEKIIAANNWDSILAGINRSSSLGNGSQYIRSIWDAKEATLLKPLRKKLIKKVVTPIVKIFADWTGNKEVLNYKWSFPSEMPFSFMADIKPENFMKVKEARERASLTPDDVNGEKYLSEMQKGGNNVQSGDPAVQGSNNN